MTSLAPLLSAFQAPPRQGLDRLVAAGFRAVQLDAAQPGLRPRELDRSARRDLTMTLARQELTLSGVDLFLPAEHLCDPARVQRAVDALVGAIDLAGALGRCPLSVHLTDFVEPQIIELLSDRAAGAGVELANHDATDEPLSALAMGIDPAAWLALGRDPVAAVTACADRLASARLVDLQRGGRRGPVGEADGQLDVLAYAVALNVVGYSRPVVVDARQWSSPEQGMLQSKAAWERAMNGLPTVG